MKGYKIAEYDYVVGYVILLWMHREMNADGKVISSSLFSFTSFETLSIFSGRSGMTAAYAAYSGTRTTSIGCRSVLRLINDTTELLLADPVEPAPLLLPVPLVALLPLVPPKFGVLVDSKSSCTGDSACDESLKLRGPRGTNIELVPAPVLPPFTVDEIDVCPLEPSKL
ncbi:hypothetical protein GQX74_008648 [Glossina fuscipes]|nr:hypothetical protein GQX74_008648 [Glossina fuscipes]